MISLLCILLLASKFSLAAELQWSDLVKATLSSNPDLASATQNLYSSENALKGSYGAFLPVISLDAKASRSDYSYSDLNFIGGMNGEIDSRSTQYGVNGSWNIFQGFSSLGTLESNRAVRDASFADTQIKSIDLRYQLRQAYFNTIMAAEQIHLYEKIRNREQDNARFIELKYNSGTEAKWNLLKTRADAHQAAFNLENAKSLFKEQLFTLERLTGISSLEIDNFHLDQNILKEKPDSEFDLEHHPSFLKSQANVTKAEKDKLSANSGFLPTLNASYSWYKQHYERISPTNNQSFSLTADWNIFNGGVDYYSREKAKTTIAAADYNLESTKRNLLEAYRKALQEFTTSLQNIPIVTEELEAANERATTVTAQYRNGLKTYLDWEQAQSLLTEAETAVIEAEKQCLLNRASLENSIGYSLEKL